MFSIYDQAPKYLLEKYQIITTVIFTAFFSLAFLLLSVPFSHNAWFKLGGNQAFGFTVAFFLIALCVVVISKRLMYSVRSREMTMLKFIVWNFSEVVVISLLYAFFTVEGADLGVIEPESISFDRIFGSALLYATISLGVPYVLCAMYFALQDKDNTIRLMNFSNVVTDFEMRPQDEKRITLYDNNGTMKFSIKQDNLYFIEADDNYIQVWYNDSNSEIRQYMLRCRLKTIEDSFSDSDLVRCHRKYIVNISKVNILKGEDKGYLLDMGIKDVDCIPVSKTYEQAVLSRFNSR